MLAERHNTDPYNPLRCQQISLDFIINSSNFFHTNSHDSVAVECIPINHQVHRLTIHPIIDVHPSIIITTRIPITKIIVTARHFIRVIIYGWIFHRPNRTNCLPYQPPPPPPHRSVGSSYKLGLFRSKNSPQRSEKASLIAPDW